MNNVALIVFGITGDLATRKLIPAIYHLLQKKRIDTIALIGAAFEDMQPDVILERAKKYIPHVDQNVWQKLHECFYYQKLNFTNKNDYFALAQLINTVEQKHQLSGNRIAYLAAASHFFCDITQYMGESGTIKRMSGDASSWQRIVYEKPFGRNLQSAHEINECIQQWFDETQIYRADHYLTKELVSNITLLRFTNCVFEPLWNNQYIDSVQIILSEDRGIENRGAYYDKYGALCDVVQNHMLELLALVAMEAPQKLIGDFVRDKRAQVLKDVRVIDGILGQYANYTHEEYVQPDSKTETFAALCLAVDNARWTGVPFYLKTGKCLNTYEVVINIKFKQVACLMLAKDCPIDSNWLTIRVAPDATFVLTLNAKKPGRSDELITIPLEFCHSCLYGEVTPDAYEVLLEEVLTGEQATSVRFDEIESAWQVIDRVHHKNFPVYSYACGSTGPLEMEQFCKKHGMRWRS
ncbi:MAG TPA: glucose-6-phosphate dehydrogenase [Candidatus Dependentiae bacterium]|nr:glucose-6-phosphate dehydrogenase [Candidatus Dependentiae bacterium]HRQ62821.1 glucose-6-phosphate dehydrogenase [Candidatus Dependentiae bacterium]